MRYVRVDEEYHSPAINRCEKAVMKFLEEHKGRASLERIVRGVRKETTHTDALIFVAIGRLLKKNDVTMKARGVE